MSQPTTLILGACPRIVVPLARCLNHQGVPVVAGSLLPGTPGIRSRVLCEFRSLTPPALSAPRFRAELEQLIQDYAVDTLIPTGDEVLAALGPEESHWRGQVHVCSPGWPIVQRVLDKRATLEAADRSGVPMPQSHVVAGPADVETLPKDFPLPAIIKPADKGRSNRLRLRSFEEREALEEFLRQHARAEEPWLVQEHVGGHGLGVEVLLHRGEAITTFQHRRLKEYPVTGGVAARCIAEAVEPELERQAIDLLRTLGWEGAAMVEYRHDPASGRTVLMEVNGRYWGSVALPLQCGVALPWYEWQIAHGLEPEPVAYRPGRRMRWLAGDLQRLPEAAGAAAAGEIPVRQAAHDTLTFFTDFLAPNTRDALWQLRDPRPALDDLRGALRQVCVQVIRKAGKLVLPASGREALERILGLGPRGAWHHRRLRRAGPPAPPSAERLQQARSVLFLCHGNIARSAASAAWLQSALCEAGRSYPEVDSAGVAALDGNRADADAMAAAARHGISLEDHRAQRVTAEHVRKADAIFVMDYSNMVRLLRAFPEARGKTWLLGSLHPEYGQEAGRSAEIRDPYGQGTRVAAACLNEIIPCLQTLLRTVGSEASTSREPSRS